MSSDKKGGKKGSKKAVLSLLSVCLVGMLMVSGLYAAGAGPFANGGKADTGSDPGIIQVDPDNPVAKQDPQNQGNDQQGQSEQGQTGNNGNNTNSNSTNTSSHTDNNKNKQNNNNSGSNNTTNNTQTNNNSNSSNNMKSGKSSDNTKSNNPAKKPSSSNGNSQSGSTKNKDGKSNGGSNNNNGGSNNNNNSNSGSTNHNSGNNSGSNSGSTKPNKPAHEHNWQPVYKTKSVDVMKKVTYYICQGCGLETTNKNTIDNHIQNAIKYDSDSACKRYKSEIREVKSGTTQEKYLDHYKCSCGKTKAAD